MGMLAGKVAIVTGSGRGIGRALAAKFARESARVVVNDTGMTPSGTGFDPSVAAKAVEEIRAAGGEALADTHDVSKRSEVEDLFRHAMDAFGRVDILVTNAGIVREGGIAEISDADWAAQLATILNSTFHCTQLFARHVERR